VTEQAVADSLGIALAAYQANLAEIQADISVLDTADVVDDTPSPEVVADERRSMSRVRDALDHLESRDITILGLHYVQELTYQQIGSTLGVTPTRVCQLLWRAVDRLRAQIA
jgi:RNA polymerase sigma factor (sigma-70 family)